MIYRVKNWDATFENYKSRERNLCSFHIVPNKQTGLGFTRLLCEPDGAAVYGIFHMILGALSQQLAPRHGYLTDTGSPDGYPWTAADLALRFRRPEAEIQRALELLSSDKIGWIKADSTRRVPAEYPPSTRRVPAEYPPSTHVQPVKKESRLVEVEVEVEGEGEEKTTKSPIAKKSSQSGRRISFDFNSRCFVGISEDDRKNWTAAYPACNLEVELNKMAAWLVANPDKRKIRYARFIVNWLSRQQDNGGGNSNGLNRENRTGNLVKGRGGAAFYRNPDARETYARREAESKANAERAIADRAGSLVEEYPDFGPSGSGSGGQEQPIPDPAAR